MEQIIAYGPGDPGPARVRPETPTAKLLAAGHVLAICPDCQGEAIQQPPCKVWRAGIERLEVVTICHAGCRETYQTRRGERTHNKRFTQVLHETQKPLEEFMKTTPESIAFGNRLKARRKLLGLKRREVAAMVDVSLSTIAKAETYGMSVSQETQEKIEGVLALDTGATLEPEPDQAPVESVDQADPEPESGNTTFEPSSSLAETLSDSDLISPLRPNNAWPAPDLFELVKVASKALAQIRDGYGQAGVEAALALANVYAAKDL